MAASVITKDLEECHLRTRHLVQYLATHLSETFFTDSVKRGSRSTSMATLLLLLGVPLAEPAGFCA